MAVTPPAVTLSQRASSSYPSSCVRCGASEGQPRGVTTDGRDVLKVQVQCAACGAEWIEVRITQPLLPLTSDA
jgi:hypothetical protein